MPQHQVPCLHPEAHNVQHHIAGTQAARDCYAGNGVITGSQRSGSAPVAAIRPEVQRFDDPADLQEYIRSEYEDREWVEASGGRMFPGDDPESDARIADTTFVNRHLVDDEESADVLTAVPNLPARAAGAPQWDGDTVSFVDEDGVTTATATRSGALVSQREEPEWLSEAVREHQVAALREHWGEDGGPAQQGSSTLTPADVLALPEVQRDVRTLKEVGVGPTRWANAENRLARIAQEHGVQPDDAFWDALDALPSADAGSKRK